MRQRCSHTDEQDDLRRMMIDAAGLELPGRRPVKKGRSQRRIAHRPPEEALAQTDDEHEEGDSEQEWKGEPRQTFGRGGIGEQAEPL